MEDSVFIGLIAVAVGAAAVALWKYTGDASAVPVVILARCHDDALARLGKDALEARGIRCLLTQDSDPRLGTPLGPWLLRVQQIDHAKAVDLLRQDPELSALELQAQCGGCGSSRGSC